MTKTLYSLSLILCLAVLEKVAPGRVLVSQTQAEVQKLEPDKTMAREISGGQDHVYEIELGAGQYLRVTADQKGIDLSLRLVAPGTNKDLAAINIIRPGGIESLSAIVETGGNYRVNVRAAGAATYSGAYVLRAETREPNGEDRKRVAAQALVLRARQLIRQGPVNAPQVIEASEQALAIWRELNNQQMIASSLTEIGGAYLVTARHDKAAEFAKEAIAVARAAGDRGGEGYALYLMLAISSAQNQSEQTIQNAELGLKIARETKDRFYESVFLGQVGAINYSLGRYEKAAEYYEQALRMAREDKARGNEGQLLVRLGMVYMGLSQSEKAIELMDPAVAIFRDLKERQSEGMALSNLGNAHSYLGRYDKATEILQQGLEIARATKNLGLEASILLTLASIQGSMGRFEKARELNESAIKLARESKDRVLEARLLLQRSNLFGILNQYDPAIDYASQALKLNRETKYLNGQGDTLSSLGSLHARQNRYDESIKYFEESLVVRRELKDQEGVSLSLSSMGETLVLLGQVEKAIKLYEEALQIGRDHKLKTRQAGALAGMGNAYRKLGQFDKSAELLAESLAINRELRRRPNEASALYHLALTERARGNLAAARSYVDESLKITESIRTELLSPETRASFLAEGQDAYRFSIDLLMRGNGAGQPARDVALAFQISERQRARSLLDLLAEARVDLRQGVDPTILERERDLARQLNAKAASQVSLLGRTHTPRQAEELEREIKKLENDYERAKAEIRRTSPGYAALTQPQPLTLKEIQLHLDPDTLLLEYSLASERSYLWAVTRDSINSFELLPEKTITDTARNLYRAMTERSRFRGGETAQQKQRRVRDAEAQISQMAQSLSSMVLDPVAAQLRNKRLVIVADGALQYIPFAMLPDPSSRTIANRRSPAPLIIGHEVVHLPSASTLAMQRNEFAHRKPAPKKVAVIADPVFSASDERLKVNPLPQTSVTSQPGDAGEQSVRIVEHLAVTSSGGTGMMRIPRLPFTRREADQILAIALDKSNLAATGFKADRATVTSGELREYRYLHFATHGFLDSEKPGLSALVLSMVDEKGEPQDGFLRVNDIYNLKLPAELVVLSACQTGLGKDVKGEGLVGLTGGFMYAGAARVVVSLWSVNDKATAELMTRFYEKMLKHGERPASALRAAQVEMWKQKQWQSPYYWAAFTMQGEWR